MLVEKFWRKSSVCIIAKLEVYMKEEEVVLEKVRLSFGSFLILMAVAGLAMALVGTIYIELITIWRIIAGDPNITISEFVKPLSSIVITPLDAIVSGIIIYPIYKYIINRYITMKIKLYRMIKPLT